MEQFQFIRNFFEKCHDTFSSIWLLCLTDTANSYKRRYSNCQIILNIRWQQCNIIVYRNTLLVDSDRRYSYKGSTKNKNSAGDETCVQWKILTNIMANKRETHSYSNNNSRCRCHCRNQIQTHEKYPTISRCLLLFFPKTVHPLKQPRHVVQKKSTHFAFSV